MAAESASSPKATDWGVGHYEHTAVQILPVAVDVVARAGIVPGERVVDVGCGTGNASLLAAARGARVTGVDPAMRLLERTEGQLTITAASAREYLEQELDNHPLAIATLSALESVGQAESLRARAIELLEAGNEAPDSFRVTSRYVIAIARR